MHWRAIAVAKHLQQSDCPQIYRKRRRERSKHHGRTAIAALSTTIAFSRAGAELLDEEDMRGSDDMIISGTLFFSADGGDATTGGANPVMGAANCAGGAAGSELGSKGFGALAVSASPATPLRAIIASSRTGDTQSARRAIFGPLGRPSPPRH